jgi:integrase/recombinase XerD
VRAIRLEDLNWRSGEIVVRGKGNTLEALPLPAAVGEAIVSYLELRGNDRSENTLFLGLRAPHEPLSSTAITVLVHRACDRAGVARIGAHRLRHTVATEMLAKGSPLAEVAMVLRQRSVRTAARYARVDHRSLRAVARAWPGGHVEPIGRDACEVAGLARPWPSEVRP